MLRAPDDDAIGAAADQCPDRRLRVLVVEDNPGDVRLIQLALGVTRVRPGFEIESVPTLGAAISRLEQAPVDVVLLDLGLPDSEGLTTLETVRSAYPYLPVMVLTVIDDDATALAAVQAGAQDYVVKGSAGDDFLARAVRHAVERHRLRTELAANLRQRSALVDLGTLALASCPVGDLIQAALDGLRDAFQVQIATFFRVEHAPEGVRLQAAVGLPSELVGELRFSSDEPSLSEYAARVGEPVVVEDLGAETRFEVPAVMHDVGIVSSAVFPVRNTHGVYGVIGVHTHRLRRFRDHDVAFLAATANVLSDAIRRTEAEAALGERVKELTCMFGVGRAAEHASSVDELCSRVIELLVPAMQFPELTVPSMSIDDKTFTVPADPYMPGTDLLCVTISAGGRDRGRVCVSYREPRDFLPEEQSLLDSIAEMVGMWLENHEAAAVIEEHRRRLQGLFDNALDAIFLADDDGRYVDVNPAGCELLGYDRDELVRLGVSDVTPCEDADAASEAWHTFLGAGRMSGPFTMVRKDGSIVETEFRAVANVVPGLHLSAIRDVTERRAMEEQLRRSEERFRALVQNSTDIIALVDAEANLIYASPAAETLLGWAPDEQVGRNMFELIHPDDVDAVVERFVSGLDRRGPNEPMEFRMESHVGEWRVLEAVSNNLLEDPAVGAIVINARDMTERRGAEEELERAVELLRRTDTERRRLLGGLIRAQEEERRRLSTEIHDDAVQAMTAVGMRLQMLRNQISDAEEQSSLRKLEDTVTDSIRRLRDMLFELRPPMLDRGGLVPALRAYLDRLFGGSGVTVRLNDELTRDPAEDVRVLMYRIAQEVLANARRHAHATSVEVQLEEKAGGLLCRIADDGRGFAPDLPSTGVPTGGGLTDIRERAELAGGWCRIDSAPGQGTTVKWWIPVGEAMSRTA